MHDVIIVGGSYAGMSAALQLARARRRVLVIDGGTRRNRFAASSHGFLGQDGRAPEAIAAAGRAEVLAYPTVTWLDGLATSAERLADGFAVSVASGERFEGKRLVLAAGVTDVVPEIPGVAERWGRSVFHCPYCHGFELGGGPVGVLATMPASTHQGILLPDWGETTYFTRGELEPDDEAREAFERRGVKVERAKVTGIEGATPDVRVVLEDGRRPSFAGLFLAPTMRVTTPIPAQLGCVFDESPLGQYVRTGTMKETTVPGVFACGDMATPAGSVTFAVGDGARAALAAHRSLIM